MRETHVLLATPMYRILGRAWASWIEAIKQARLAMPHVRFMHMQSFGNPLHVEGGHNIVTVKYQEIQNVFLANDWWAMVAIEDDMILPPDALIRAVNLLADGADIGYGLYVWRHGRPKWSAYTELNARSGTSISDDPAAARAAWGKVIDVEGVGLGITAIKRPVLEALRMRRGGHACNDWYMALDAKARGFVQRCDLGLVCGHMTTEPSPRVLWPDPDPQFEKAGMTRVQFLPEDAA